MRKALDRFEPQLRVIGYGFLLFFVAGVLYHLTDLDFREDFKHLKIVLVAFEDKLLLSLQSFDLFRLL